MDTEKKQKIKDYLEEKAFKYGLIIIGILATMAITYFSSKGEVKIYKQNKAVEYEGAEYKITKVEKLQDELHEDYYDFRVTIKITNIGKKDVDYSSMNYTIANKDGEKITVPGAAVDDGTYLRNGTLAPGESVEGIVAWNVKKDAKDIRVRYFKDIITATKGEFEFQWALDN